MNIDFNSEINSQLDIVRKLKTSTGVFTASAQTVSTGYDKAWLRDIFFIVLGFMEAGDMETVRTTGRALLDVFIKHKDKINWAIENKPSETWQFVHARFHPETFEEFWEEWGNKQHDAVGEILNLISELELRGQTIIKVDEDKEMVQKIVDYLVAIEYWHDADNGIWEESEEVHASSIGSVVAALKSTTSFVDTSPRGRNSKRRAGTSRTSSSRVGDEICGPLTPLTHISIQCNDRRGNDFNTS